MDEEEGQREEQKVGQGLSEGEEQRVGQIVRQEVSHPTAILSLIQAKS